MIRHLSKRAFLIGSASLAGAKALGQVPASGEVEVAIIGAGAAGIAAARRVAITGRTYALLEAAPRIGGRVWSGAGRLGIAHDRGAHFMSASGRNPLVAIGRLERLDLKNVSPFRRMYVGQREARDNEYDAFTAALRRASRAIAAAGEAGRDIPASQAMPDLREWNATAAFVLGPHALSKDLDLVSTVDFSRIEEQAEEVICRTGLAHVLAAGAKSLTVTLDAPVARIGQIGRGPIAIETSRGIVRAETAIITVSTGVLTSGRIRFESPLPKRTLDAAESLSLGTRDRLIFELKGNPFKFADDQKIIFKGSGPDAIGLTGRAGGSDLCFAEFSGGFGREMSAKGEAAMAAFVTELLVEHFGSDARTAIGRVEAVRWSDDPLILGGTSVAAPGRGASRRVLAEPLFDRLFLAGEALHETWFGTVAGAWVSGERAADAALRHFTRKTAPTPAAKGKK